MKRGQKKVELVEQSRQLCVFQGRIAGEGMSPGLGIRGAKSLDPLYDMLVHDESHNSFYSGHSTFILEWK